MTRSQYSIGIDFGTLSARALLFDISDGHAIAESECLYAHAVMETALPDGLPLPPQWALQHPQDYLDALDTVLPRLMQKANVSAESIVGIGIDFTSCTVLPTDKEGTPLCLLPNFSQDPHAYIKLWKHHSAKPYADRINETAAQREAKWLIPCGGKISPEWLFPKLLQIYCEAPAIFDAMEYFVEAGDWIVWQLTGNLIRNTAAAGFVGNWNSETGYPPIEDLNAVQDGFGTNAYPKLAGLHAAPGAFAGGLLPNLAAHYGLLPDTPVGVAHMDSQASLPALGIHAPGSVLAVMGTSTVYLLLDSTERYVPGIGSVVKDGIIPGFYGYSAGQSCVGEHFAWVAKNCTPPSYYEEAEKKNLSIQQLLTEKAAMQQPGEHGLLALDWFNGNRSILLDMHLSGCILGMSLHTKPEDIYRALIEATAFGAKVIIENFRAHGIDIQSCYASGGISKKNALAMQIYADILQLPIYISDAGNGPALGAGILGAVAGSAYDTIGEASAAMGRVLPTPYLPIAENTEVYEQLYEEYLRLHDLFGRGGNTVMHKLHDMKNAVKQRTEK